MLDIPHIPRAGGADIQIFTRPSGSLNIDWMTWAKPRGATMLHMYLIGGGGGGGGGLTGASTTTRGGGGGGGSSAQSSLLIPLMFLPDVLYVNVGIGGLGAFSGGTAGGGTQTMVNVTPEATSTVSSNCVLLSGGTGGLAGASGNAGGGGSGGTAGSSMAVSSAPLSTLGIVNWVSGNAGSNGGPHTGGDGQANAIPSNGCVCQGGTGGGGTQNGDFAGGACTAITQSFLSSQRSAFAAAGSNNGSGGIHVERPFFCFGGMGGGSSDAGVGGEGGNGIFGSGGGGGGGGTTGGRGGNGGGGIAIFTCW